MDQGGRRAVPRILRAAARLVLPGALAASLAVGGTAAPAVGDPASSAPAAPVQTVGAARDARIDDAPAGAVSAYLAPIDGGTLAPGGDLTLDLLVVNRTDAPVDAGTAAFSIEDRTIDTRTSFESWIRPQSTGPDDELGAEIARAEVPAIEPGDDESVRVTVPAAALTGLAADEFGPHGVAARYLVGGSETAQARSTVVVAAPGGAQPTPVSVIVPIVPPQSTEAVIPVNELETLTAPSGRLAELLDAVAGTNATLAIDPRVLLSIRVLGDTAPPSATAWLARLESLPNQSFALPYGDADVTLQLQAGEAAPRPVTSIEFAVDESLGTSPTPKPTDGPDEATPTGTAVAGTPAPDGTVTATPTPTEQPEVVYPDYAELTEFPYTISDVVWPSAGTVGAADLATLDGLGAQRIVLDGSNATLDDETTVTPPAPAVVDGWSALVADTRLSEAVAAASAATTESEWSAATATASALLAVVSRELPYEPRPMLATVGRPALEQPDRLGALLRHLDGTAWADVTPAAFPSTDAEPDGVTIAAGTLVEGRHAQPVIDQAVGLLRDEDRAAALVTIFDDPEAAAGRTRAQLLTVLSAGWVPQGDAWNWACDVFGNEALAPDRDVRITDTSSIQLVGRDSQIPVFVENRTDRRVTVQVVLRPTTGRIEAREAVTLVIEQGSMARAQLPVSAITNGVTSADVLLLTPDGVNLDSTVSLDVNVQAEWETVGIAVFTVGLVLLFVAGVVRTIRKRRRERVVASTGPDEVGASEE